MFCYHIVVSMKGRSCKHTYLNSPSPLSDKEVSTKISQKLHVSIRYLTNVELVRLLSSEEARAHAKKMSVPPSGLPSKPDVPIFDELLNLDFDLENF